MENIIIYKIAELLAEEIVDSYWYDRLKGKYLLSMSKRNLNYLKQFLKKEMVKGNDNTNIIY